MAMRGKTAPAYAGPEGARRQARAREKVGNRGGNFNASTRNIESPTTQGKSWKSLSMVPVAPLTFEQAGNHNPKSEIPIRN
jgi:hypothetical protein